MIIDCISEIEQMKIEEDSFLLVRVGSEKRPATIDDIEDMKKSINDLRIPNLKCLITHHDVDFKVCVYDKTHHMPTLEGERNA